MATVHAGQGEGGAGLEMGRKRRKLIEASGRATTGFGQQQARFRYATSDVRQCERAGGAAGAAKK